MKTSDGRPTEMPEEISPEPSEQPVEVEEHVNTPQSSPEAEDCSEEVTESGVESTSPPASIPEATPPIQSEEAETKRPNTRRRQWFRRPQPVPNYIIPQWILQAIMEETDEHTQNETGHALIGVYLKSENLVMVLAVVPDFISIYRSPGLFRQGGQGQVDIFRWYNDHWKTWLDNPSLANWQLGQPIPPGTLPEALKQPLIVVGDWHKHPGHFNELSGTDLRTITELLSDSAAELDFILTPILTVNRLYDGFEIIEGSEFTLIDRFVKQYRLNWFYHHKSGQRSIRIKPHFVEDNRVPWMPPLPWYLTDPVQFEREIATLRRLGYHVRWIHQPQPDDPTHLIVFGIDHPRWHSQVVIKTPWDYRKMIDQVSIDLIPKPQTDSEQQNQGTPQANDLGRNVFGWVRNLFNPQSSLASSSYYSRGTYLVDLVKQLEKEHINDPRNNAPISGGVSESESDVVADPGDEEPGAVTPETGGTDSPDVQDESQPESVAGPEPTPGPELGSSGETVGEPSDSDTKE